MRKRTQNISTGKGADGKWIKPNAWCGHCANDGFVELDSAGIVPCPMCAQGWVFEKNQYGIDGYWGHHDLLEAVWNGGLTIRHERRCAFVREGAEFSCGRPSAGLYCNGHAVDANRVPVRPRSLSDAVKQARDGIRPELPAKRGPEGKRDLTFGGVQGYHDQSKVEFQKQREQRLERREANESRAAGIERNSA